MLLLVTVTKDRPAAFAQLARLVERQSVEEYDWLVVTDGWEGYKFPKKCKVVKRTTEEDKLPSICENWVAACDWIEAHPQYDKIIVLEDDDWYHPDYCRETKKHLDKSELIGWHEDAYYFVMVRKPLRYHNVGHAALASTAFQRSVVPWVKQCSQQGQTYIDMLIWHGLRETTLVRQPPLKLPDGTTREVAPVPVSTVIQEFKGTKQLLHNFTGLRWQSREMPQIDPKTGDIVDEHPRHVGMKTNWHGGMQGTSSRGHDPSIGGGFDTKGKMLRKWIGKDADFYLAFSEEFVPETPKSAGGKGSIYQPNIVHHDLPIESDSFWSR